MFQSRPPTRRRDDEIDAKRTREPADFLERPAFQRVHVFPPDHGRFRFRDALEMRSDATLDFDLRHDERQSRHARERIIGGKNVREVQFRLKFLDERKREGERFAGRRREIDRDEHPPELESRRATARAAGRLRGGVEPRSLSCGKRAGFLLHRVKLEPASVLPRRLLRKAGRFLGKNNSLGQRPTAKKWPSIRKARAAGLRSRAIG